MPMQNLLHHHAGDSLVAVESIPTAEQIGEPSPDRDEHHHHAGPNRPLPTDRSSVLGRPRQMPFDNRHGPEW